MESAPRYGEPATWLLLVMGGLLRSLVEDGDVARFHPLARLEGGPLVTKRSHLGGSPYGGVNFSGFDSICVNIDWSGSK